MFHSLDRTAVAFFSHSPFHHASASHKHVVRTRQRYPLISTWKIGIRKGKSSKKKSLINAGESFERTLLFSGTILDGTTKTIVWRAPFSPLNSSHPRVLTSRVLLLEEKLALMTTNRGIELFLLLWVFFLHRIFFMFEFYYYYVGYSLSCCDRLKIYGRFF